MRRLVLDMESDGLLDTITKIHCVCYYDIDTKESVSLTSYQDMMELLSQEDLTIIGHNIRRFDIPAFKIILGIDFKGIAVDTLGLSWYLYPSRKSHNLYEWGVDLNIAKPEVEDWTALNISVYVHRCEEDVKINTALFFMQIQYLMKIYGTKQKADRIIGYISFKLKCAAEQEAVKWKLNVLQTIDNLEILFKEKEVKREILKEVMPKVVKYAIRSLPKVMYKQDGELSANGEKWFARLDKLGLPRDHMGAIKEPVGEEVGNPNSHDQIKDWLKSLGWQPETFKYVKDNPTSPMRAIPQINLIDGSDICPSIKALYEIEPKLINIENYFVISHRIGILEGFLECKDKDNFLKAEIAGLTNTLRFQHVKPLTNLPTIHKAYGKYVRGVLIAPTTKHLLCGADMSSLEDSTKQHYMFRYDPSFVAEMQTPGFDPHLDIAKQGAMVSEEDIAFYKDYEIKSRNSNNTFAFTDEENKRYKAIKKIRANEGKKTNFSAVYGVGIVKLSLINRWHHDKSRKMLNIYWKRNWAVKKIAKNCRVRTVNGQMWLFNPVSQFWYSLRYDKDRFSTLNQGTGDYCFNTWVRKVRAKGIKLCGQFHDEIVFPLLPKDIEEVKTKLNKAIDETNEELELNVKLRISIDFGKNYAEIH
jgi:hypothetical protein